MREVKFDGDRQGRVEMRVLVDSSGTDKMNAEERKVSGKGFTSGGNMRKVANIDPDELHALMANGDKDALDFALSGYSDRRALRRLLYRFPLWRCSEGAL